jgi:hypothetical protein
MPRERQYANFKMSDLLKAKAPALHQTRLQERGNRKR